MPRIACFEWLLFSGLLLTPALTCRAEGPEPEDSSPKDELAEARLKYMTKALQKYTAVLDGNQDEPAKLNPKVGMRWSNPVGDVVDGLLTIYAKAPAARPAVVAHFHLHGSVLNGLEMHEFADVHPGGVELYRGDRKIWSPRERYGKFQALPGAPKPSMKAPLRLAQIKSMASRFEIIDAFRAPNSEPQPQPLRMMARPTYRYGSEDDELVDGALFTFVLATDPEACLLIEIHRNGTTYMWEYLLIPMTIYALDAKFDGQHVWSKPEAMVFGDPRAAHYIAPYRGDPGEESMRTLVPKENP